MGIQDIGVPKIIEADYQGTDGEIVCPVCLERIDVKVIVEIVKGASVRKAGEEGYRRPIHTVSVETKIRGVRIHHECSTMTDGLSPKREARNNG